jgi:hypothetical protein
MAQTKGAQTELSVLDAQIASERTVLEQALKRMMELSAERERIRIALKIMSRSENGLEDSSTSNTGPKRTSEVLLDALRSAPDGLTGARLHEIGSSAGMTKSAVDRSRSRLKNAGRIEARNGLWFLSRASRSSSDAAALSSS